MWGYGPKTGLLRILGRGNSVHACMGVDSQFFKKAGRLSNTYGKDIEGSSTVILRFSLWDSDCVSLFNLLFAL